MSQFNQVPPIPSSLTNLPNAALDEFVNDPALLRGFVKQLNEFRDYLKTYSTQLTGDEAKLQEIGGLIKRYEELDVKIRSNVTHITELIEKFRDLQVVQYLLLTSYSHEALVAKYKEIVDGFDASLRKVIESQEGDSLDFLAQFKKERKNYHLHREKLNRCVEDRVLGST